VKNDSDEPAFPLEPALDFLQRLWRMNHALERLSARMERSLGVTAQQRLVVRCIGKYPGITAGQLAGLLHVDPGTLSAALGRLERKGLVARRRDPRDRRRVSLGLTKAGRDLDAPTDGTVEAAVEALLESAGAKKTEAAVEVIERFTDLLDRQIAE
jgi:DNA-binding MarR family transcriptional regulator